MVPSRTNLAILSVILWRGSREQFEIQQVGYQFNWKKKKKKSTWYIQIMLKGFT